MIIKLNPYIYFYIVLFSTTLFAQQSGTKIPLWEKGAPGFEHLKDEPEQAQDWWVRNVHNPSITAFFPEKPNGMAVLICPGGGHENLVFNSEGKDAAVYLNSIGITAFVLKYRLARGKDSLYKLETHVKQDAERAMRLIRSKAADFNIDPNRLGAMGFSAGGEVVALIAYQAKNVSQNPSDAIDKHDAQPNFQILIYPGPLFIPKEIKNDAPPAFLLAANDDMCCAAPIVELLNGYRKTNVPVEVHLYSKGGHAFNTGKRAKTNALRTWPQRLADWFEDNNYFSK
ncbi:alpha/beta hydrolase fold domain-containing protein [Flavobacterium sp. GA093]|uniref:Alpha/beta hydrolase fold domain-containing protein n=1 Tax=Flavobacterium hydrocarbonoxydans TaxID=2683249 RepID=A0A6I4NY92_9FLAO|nr:alpha/beta hydrolase [Flavobacterium hydrocarbonoxydans]MWB96729.1 alpha/beta hydrolase fold domain-containing protein [Flavobacterium hydrocarbonoxydans]